jgi:Bacterial PH domain
VHELRFTIAWRQLRGLLAYTLIMLAIAVGLSVAWAAAGSPGSTGAWALGIGIGAMIAGYSTAAYGVAFTKCTPEGIRTRGLAGPRMCRWADVADIRPRLGSRGTRTVVVTTNSGQRFYLGAPVSSPIMRDRMFPDKYRQIISYWRHAVQDLSKPEDPASGSLITGLANETAIAGSAAAPLTGLTSARPAHPKPGQGQYLKSLRWIGWLAAAGFAASGAVLLFFGIRDVSPAWAAHLGQGVTGVFTATSARQWQDCTQSCHTATEWFGTFTSRYGTRVGVPINPDGAHITAIGQHEAVLYESDGWAYANGGGPDWLLTTLMVVGGIALVAFSAIRALRALWRRKTLKDQTAAA